MYESYKEDPSGADLLTYLHGLWKRKWEALLIINCVMIVSLVRTLWFVDEVYEAEATIMPLKSSGGAVSSLRNVLPTGLVPSLPASLGGEDLNRFLNILQSRTMAQDVVLHLDLMNLLYADVPLEERPALQKVVKQVKNQLVRTRDNQQGLVQLITQANSPQLAADIANAYVQHLHRYLKENTATESQRNRIFIGEQYDKALRDLEKAERQLQTFKEKHRLFSVSAQTEEMIARIGTLRGNLMAKEAEMNVSKRGGMSENNPQYRKLMYEIEELKRQIAQLEQGTSNTVDVSSVVLEAVPALERELAQLMREKIVQETLYQLLAQQYKQAEISEANDEISFLTLDYAVPPLLRIKPSRKQDLVLGGVVGLMFATAYAMVYTLLERYRLSETED